MNGAQIHLLVNHFPVVTLVLSLPLLAWGLFRKNEFANQAGLALVLVAGVSVLPAYFSGDPAEEVVEDKVGVSEKMIHNHEEAAEAALVGVLLTAGLAVASIGLERFKRPQVVYARFGTLAVGLVSAVLIA